MVRECLNCGKEFRPEYDPSFCSNGCLDEYGDGPIDFDPETCDPLDFDDPAPM